MQRAADSKAGTLGVSAEQTPFRPLDRWVDALLDERRGGAALALSLIAYTLAWTVYRIVATAPRDIHPDMSELYAWAENLAWGYDKHPPFSAAVTRVWFAVVPVSDATFTLLATVNIAVTLALIFAISRRFMTRDKAIFGLALMALVPLFNFQALKYNANTVMLPLWAATAYCFLRAYDSRRWTWAVLAGVAAGCAMLGKYWSIFLVAGLGLAAIIDHRRAAFFRSPAPWLTGAAGAAVIAPHVVWLFRVDFLPFAYASARTDGTLGAIAASAAGYLFGSLAYVLPAIVLVLAWAKPDRAALRDTLWPQDDQRRLAVLALVLPLVLPALVAPVADLKLTPLWSLPNWSLLPVVLLASPLITLPRIVVRRALGLAALLTLGALALSPAIAIVLQLSSAPRPEDFSSVVADDIVAQWRETSDRPVAFVGGDPGVAMSAAYYLKVPARPFGWGEAGMPQALAAGGGVLVCPASEDWCLSKAESYLASQPAKRRIEIARTRSLFGISGRPIRYVVMIVQPKGGG